MEHERKRRPAEQASHHRQTQKRKSSGGIVRRVLFIVGTLLLVGICTGAMMLGIFLKYVDTTLSSSLQVRAEDYTMSLSSVIYYQDKESGEWVEYQNIYGVENRIWADLEDMPDALCRPLWPLRTNGFSSTTVWTGCVHCTQPLICLPEAKIPSAVPPSPSSCSRI